MMATYTETHAIGEGEGGGGPGGPGRGGGGGVTADDLQDMMVQKAHELFIVCDKESKGFITKRDMQRLQAELPLSPDQLEAVFDSLDDDANGFLTLEEFTGGFAKQKLDLQGSYDLEEDSVVKLSLEELRKFKHLATAGRRPYSYSSSSEDDIDEVLIKGFGRCPNTRSMDMDPSCSMEDSYEEELHEYIEEGSFLGVTPVLQHQDSMNSSGGDVEKIYENAELHDSEDDNEHFDDLLSTLGAHGLFEDVDVIKSLWGRIRKDEPEMLTNFEDFLGRVILDIKRSHSDLNTLEGILKSKSVSHDEEVRKLYDEMENQIRLEKERIIAEEKAKEKQLRDELEKELQEKETQLLEFQSKTQYMEDRLLRLNSNETETKLENEKLMREKEELETMLLQSQRHLDESKAYIGSLRKKHKDEKRERAMAALQISEGIAMERESLVKQLDMLRDMNRRLRDDKDEMDMKRESFNLQQELAEMAETSLGAMNGKPDSGCQGDSENEDEENLATKTPGGTTQQTPRRKRPHLSKQGSILSSYFGNSRSMSMGLMEEEDEEDIECDEFEHLPASAQLYNMSLAHELNTSGAMSTLDGSAGATTTNSSSRLRGLRNSFSDSEDLGDEIDGGPRWRRRSRASNGMATILREQPVGANDVSTSSEAIAEVLPTTPERVFKVVFVGDSGVGKSSYIHRFCNAEFKATFSATIGVDFQVKNLVVDNHCVALQLWDTAGQERFRSITKQYFRKADGVLVMYDVTSESSFLNVRNWFASVQEGCEDGTVLVLVGNKIDLSMDEDRVVKTKDGAYLADEFGALFYETSAKSGVNVKETLAAMASILREREDREMEKALQLKDHVPEKKSGCCS